MDSSRRFLAVFAAVTVAGLLGVATLNALVDPYGIYGLWQRPGLNANKAQQIFHDRLVRAHAVRAQRPDALLLGTSRTQVGLEPGSPVLAARAGRAVNLGLSGGSAYEALRYLQHASALGEVRFALVGLDALAFNAYAQPNPEYTEERLAVDADLRPNPTSFAADWLPTLLSMEAVRASALTVLRQREPSYFYASGRRQETTFEQRVVSEGGARATMLWSEDYYLGEYACFAFRRPGGEAPALEDLRRLLAFARERNIHLYLFFSPSHARSQLALTAAGHWPAAEQWKREVSALVQQAGDGVELWEFSGADPRYTAEPVPPAGNTQARMRWYWESSHYRHALGERVLARIFGEAAPEDAGFGVRLLPSNLEQELRRVADEVDAYASAHPDEVEEIGRLAAKQRASWTRCANGAPGPVTPPGPGLARDE